MSTKQKAWFVEYRVPKHTGDQIHIAGPYHFPREAYQHLEDIRGYEGVTDVRMSERECDL